MSKMFMHPHTPRLLLLTVPLLQFFLVCASVFSIRMWRLFCPYFFLMFPALSLSGWLCVVLVTFPWYLHLYASINTKQILTFSGISVSYRLKLNAGGLSSMSWM